MSMWSPWRGCHKKSEGCKYCYIHKGDKRKGVDTNIITKTPDFYRPIEKKKNSEYKIKENSLVYLCFSTDFLIEEADEFRDECWKMIKQRSDCHFLFLTKRIERFSKCIPNDWNEGYDNVTVCCTVENQVRTDERLQIFNRLPIKHKIITIQPMIEKIDISKYLTDIEEVVVGGESDRNARPLNYDWVLDIKQQCLKSNVSFTFRQCGTYFIKDGIKYTLKTKDLMSQARKANIDHVCD